ncbi:molybdenum cofactor guanylyltransferase [soil metagenome]
MGADKALLDWDGRRAVDRVWDLAREACAGPIFIVGGEYGHASLPDPFPDAGPVAGLLIGAAALKAQGCGACLVLAVDAPTLRVGDLQPLLRAAEPGAAYDGLPLPMSLTFDSIPAETLADWPLQRLVERAGLAILACSDATRARARGANDPAERAALLANLPAPNA